MNLQGTRLMVVGGAGLVGSHVVDELLKEDVAEIIVFDNFCRGRMENLNQALKDPRCRVFEAGGDILHPDILNAAMKGVDAVFHLAALWLLQCHEFPGAAFEVNVRGAFNVLEACVANQVRRIVFSSSASVYGEALEEPMTENHPYNNWTFYGATKIAGEHMLKAFHRRYGLEGVGLRYMNVYGPRQDYRGTYVSVIMRILDRLDQGLPPVIYGDGTQAFDFIYVSDTARSNLCALKSDAPFGFYNVGRGIKTSIRDLARLIMEIKGVSLPIQFETEGMSPVSNRLGDPRAAEQDLGFRWQVGLEEGLRKLMAWRNRDLGRSEMP